MDQLDQGLTAIILQSGLFCMGIFLLTYVVRRVVETGWAGAKNNKWWTEVFLPLGPIATGVLLAFAAKSYAWPEIAKDPWSRAFYGGVCGLSSGWVYSRFRSILKAWVSSPLPAGKVPVQAEVVINGLPDSTPTSLGAADVPPVADSADSAEDKTPVEGHRHDIIPVDVAVDDKTPTP